MQKNAEQKPGNWKLGMLVVLILFYVIVGLLYLGFKGGRAIVYAVAEDRAESWLMKENYEKAGFYIKIFKACETGHNYSAAIMQYFCDGLRYEAEEDYKHAHQSYETAETFVGVRKKTPKDSDDHMYGDDLNHYYRCKARAEAKYRQMLLQNRQDAVEDELQQMDQKLRELGLPGRSATPEELEAFDQNYAAACPDLDICLAEQNYHCRVYRLDSSTGLRFYYFFSDDSIVYIMEYELTEGKITPGLTLEELNAKAYEYKWFPKTKGNTCKSDFLDGEVQTVIYTQNNTTYYFCNGILIDTYTYKPKETSKPAGSSTTGSSHTGSSHSGSSGKSTSDIYADPDNYYDDVYDDYYDEFWDYEDSENDEW